MLAVRWFPVCLSNGESIRRYTYSVQQGSKELGSTHARTPIDAAIADIHIGDFSQRRPMPQVCYIRLGYILVDITRPQLIIL